MTDRPVVTVAGKQTTAAAALGNCPDAPDKTKLPFTFNARFPVRSLA